MYDRLQYMFRWQLKLTLFLKIPSFWFTILLQIQKYILNWLIINKKNERIGKWQNLYVVMETKTTLNKHLCNAIQLKEFADNK